MAMCKCGRHDEMEMSDCAFSRLRALVEVLEAKSYGAPLPDPEGDILCDACGERLGYIEDRIDGELIGILCRGCADLMGILQ